MPSRNPAGQLLRNARREALLVALVWVLALTWTVGGVTARLFQFLILRGWIRRITRKKLVVIALKQNKHLAYLSECFEAGRLEPVIDGPYTLGDAKDAFRHFGTAMHKGKVVITID